MVCRHWFSDYLWFSVNPNITLYLLWYMCRLESLCAACLHRWKFGIQCRKSRPAHEAKQQRIICIKNTHHWKHPKILDWCSKRSCVGSVQDVGPDWKKVCLVCMQLALTTFMQIWDFFAFFFFFLSFKLYSMLGKAGEL